MRRKLATAEVIMAHVTGRSPGVPDHFAGVELALRSRGVTSDRLFPGQWIPRLTSRTRVVLVPNTESSVCRYLVREARRVGAVSLLLMDGIVEWRNTFINARGGPAFLRPAPVDVVACAGSNDQQILAALGNDAVATGLPRLAAGPGRSTASPVSSDVCGGSPTLLIATAKSPTFHHAERAPLHAAIVEWRDAAEALGVRVVWRLGADLDALLGVTSDSRPLGVVLSECDAVATTASTLMVETMLAGRPTALIHPFPTPLWQPCATIHQPVSVDVEAVRERMADLPIERREALLGLAEQHADSFGRSACARDALSSLISKNPARSERQSRALSLLHTPAPGAADALTSLIRDLMERPRYASRAAVFPRATPISCVPPTVSGVTRVVCVVKCEQASSNVALDWARRAAQIVNQSCSALDLRILAITTGHDAWLHASQSPPNDEALHTCVVDTFDDLITTSRRIDAALSALSPSLVVAGDRDLCMTAAIRARSVAAAQGRVVPFVGLAAEGSEHERSLLGYYHVWDAVLSTCAAADAVAKGIAQERGVPCLSFPLPPADAPASAMETFVGELRASLAFVTRSMRAPVPSALALNLTTLPFAAAPPPLELERASAWARQQITRASRDDRGLPLETHRHLEGARLPRLVVDESDSASLLSAPVDSEMNVMFPSLLDGRLVCGVHEESQRVHARLHEAVSAGCSRLLLYGIGQHLFKHAVVFDEGFPIVGIIDDDPPSWPFMFGVPVRSTRDALSLSPDAVILFSDRWEALLWERSAFLRRAGVRVFAVYGAYADFDALSAPQPLSVR